MKALIGFKAFCFFDSVSVRFRCIYEMAFILLKFVYTFGHLLNTPAEWKQAVMDRDQPIPKQLNMWPYRLPYRTPKMNIKKRELTKQEKI